MLITNEFDDYEIISMSDGEKLERWGKFYLLRPDPEIIWKESLDKSIIHAYYHRSTTGGGYWDVLKKLPSSWCVNYKDLTFETENSRCMTAANVSIMLPQQLRLCL